MYRLGSVLGITCCWRNSRKKTKDNETTVKKKFTMNPQKKQDRSELAKELAKDAALRQQMIIPEGAPTGEEGPSADDPLSTLPKELMVGVLMLNLDSNSLARFSQTSKNISLNDAIVSANSQLQRLKEELNELITNSGITGIKNPVGPFKNSIHQLRVLTAFKDAIRVLRRNGITDINATDNLGFPPLHWAAMNGHTEIARALLELGADVNADNFGAKPLHWAAMNGHTEIARALIELGGADVNADNFGSTPLHEAARYGHTETVRALINAKADKDAKDNYGYTPLHLAERFDHTETAQALINAGAKSRRACIIM